MRLFLLAALAVMLSRAAVAAPDLGAQVVDFARAHIGQRVGDGECATLAVQALHSAHARSLENLMAVIAVDGDYVWGALVPAESARPGDIIQFRNFSTSRREVQANGSWQETRIDRPHHTAIVVSNEGDGQYTVVEQNAPVGGPVHLSALCLTNGTHEVGGLTVTTTATGQYWFYRPQPYR